MAMFGHKNSGPPSGSERVLAYLLEVQRLGGPFKIEDALGCEVSATLDQITGKGVTLTPQGSLNLGKGAETQLVFVLDGLRFTAFTSVLEVDPGTVTVELPAAVHLAERRKMSRGYLSAREGAAAMAMAGLFNPLTAGSMASLEPSHALVDEMAVRSGTADGSHHDPMSMAAPEVSEAGRYHALRVELPWTSKEVASDSVFWTSPVVDWLKVRNITLNSRTTASVMDQSVRTAAGGYTVYANNHSLLNFTGRNPFIGQSPSAKKMGSNAFVHGLTYTFMTRTLPEKWRHTLLLSSVRLEAYCSGNNLQLGLRVR